MEQLNYLSSKTPARRFRRFNELEERFGTAGLLSIACATIALAPVCVATAVYALARVQPALLYVAYALAFLLSPLAILPLALPPIGILAACFGLSGPKRRFALEGLLLNTILVTALIVIWMLYGRR